MATLAAYKSWCQDEKVQPSHCIVLEGVDKVGFSKDTVVNHLKNFAQVNVVGFKDVGPDSGNVLCQFKKPCKQLPLPPVVKVAEGIEWKLVLVDSTDDGDDPNEDFDSLLKTFLESHGKSPGDYVKKTSPPPPDTPQTVKSIVEHVVTTPHHRRIKPFSGKKPVASGEWDFDTWDRVVTQSVLGGSLSSQQQRSSIIDSLLPPALDITHDSTLDTPQKLVEALRKAYGVVKDGNDLYAEFRDTYQVDTESPSEFLVRLNGILQQVVQQGGLDEQRIDWSRLDQFLRGCLFKDDIITDLGLRGRKEDPPSFVDLLQMLRAEESRRAERDRRRKMNTTPSNPQKAVKVQQQAAKKPHRLEQQVADLRKQLAVLQARSNTVAAPAPATVPPRVPRMPRRPLFCYRCGEDGHGMRACNKPVNATLVQKKLSDRMTRSSGNFPEPPRRDEREAH